MKGLFELAMGSVLGKEHRRLGRNNQDAYATYQDEFCTVAVVADGCGSQPFSEVGAQIGAGIACARVADMLKSNGFRSYPEQVNPRFFRDIQQEILEAINFLELSMGVDGQRLQTLADYFLFTLIGIIVQPVTTHLFWLGDGAIAINGNIDCLDYPGNAPPYLAYDLPASQHDPIWPKQTFCLRQMPTEEVETFMIGSDGVGDLIAAAEKPVPGKTDLVGPIELLWQDDRFYRNPDRLHRHLRLVNGGINPGNLGHLPDDTTLVVGRLIREEER